ncbi:MAG TPA: cupredoxin domain-containing protein [Nitrososphaera sp.]|nr:cupredoxin domain-containing protein [Nitrososphaera sp.]
MRNNIIAIVAISFVIVGALWGVGNLIESAEPVAPITVEGITLVAENGAFNGTNPNLSAEVNVPIKLVIQNQDVVTHDLIIEDKSGGILNVNTAPLRPNQHFNAAILGYKPGTYEYYCSYHPEMRGSIHVS